MQLCTTQGQPASGNASHHVFSELTEHLKIKIRGGKLANDGILVLVPALAYCLPRYSLELKMAGETAP